MILFVFGEVQVSFWKIVTFWCEIASFLAAHHHPKSNALTGASGGGFLLFVRDRLLMPDLIKALGSQTGGRAGGGVRGLDVIWCAVTVWYFGLKDRRHYCVNHERERENRKAQHGRPTLCTSVNTFAFTLQTLRLWQQMFLKTDGRYVVDHITSEWESLFSFLLFLHPFKDFRPATCHLKSFCSAAILFHPGSRHLHGYR